MKISIIWLSAATIVTAIWPIPLTFTTGNETLWIDENVTFDIEKSTVWRKRTGDQSDLPQDIEIIELAIKKAKEVIFNHNFVPWKFYPRGAKYEPATSTKNLKIRHVKIVHGVNKAKVTNGYNKDSNEFYYLTVKANGDVELVADTGIGILRGLTSFSQLFNLHSQGGIYMTKAPVTVKDAPTFSWRGINFDVSRHFYPVRSIEHLIDTMSFNKLNKLHLHITDSQAWPLEIKTLPDLAMSGAYHPGMIYTTENVESLQRYGALRGVEVFLEIDMPGHTSSVYYAYPDLVAAFNEPQWGGFAYEPPSGTLKLNSSKVNDFVEKVIGDLVPRVKRFTKYFHTGGDEVNANAYEKDETVRTDKHDELRPFMKDFIQRSHQQILAAGMTPVVWQEMAITWDLPLDKSVVVQSWMGSQSVSEVTKLGYKVIAGNNDNWYLDCGHGAFLDPSNERTSYPYTGCSPRKNWRQVYTYEPWDQVPENERHLVLGGEVHVWSEIIDHVNMDVIVWPRTSAAAEVLWSGSKDANGKYRSVKEAAIRLAQFRERMVAQNVMAEPVHMPFCTMEKGQCDG